jgi:hypothetical protein
MSYNAKVKLQYINDSETTPSKYFPELVDQMTVTIEAPASDLNVYQYYELFKSFLLSLGFQHYSVMDGACRLAFNDSVDEDVMKKIMKEYELQDKQIHTDDEYDKLEERALEWEKRYWNLRHNMQRQENPDLMPPWGHSDMEALQYTEEELNAMCDAAKDKESCKEMTTRELEWVKDEKQPTHDEMIAKGYEMTADGFWIPKDNMKVSDNDPMMAWNRLIPGSKEAVKKGCKCPVMDNAEMPEDRKWVNGDCLLHGKVK